MTHPDDRPVELRVDVFVRPGTAPDPVFDQYAADLVAAAGAGS